MVLFVLDNLLTPASKNQHHIVISPFSTGTYYRLGKNLPSSGNFVRTSLSALSFHIIAVSPTITTPNTAVFAFQFEGCEYQPPAGDQTCLGYLAWSNCVPRILCIRGLFAGELTYGILPPPPWELLMVENIHREGRWAYHLDQLLNCAGICLGPFSGRELEMRGRN